MVNKSEFLEIVRRNLGGTATRMAAEYALKAVLDAVSSGLEKDGKVQIVGFGTFQKKMRAARMVQNPKTGEPVALPEKPSVTFRASSFLKG